MAVERRVRWVVLVAAAASMDTSLLRKTKADKTIFTSNPDGWSEFNHDGTICTGGGRRQGDSGLESIPFPPSGSTVDSTGKLSALIESWNDMIDIGLEPEKVFFFLSQHP